MYRSLSLLLTLACLPLPQLPLHSFVGSMPPKGQSRGLKRSAASQESPASSHSKDSSSPASATCVHASNSCLDVIHKAGLNWIMDFLQQPENHAKILVTKGWLESGMATHKKQKVADGAYFHATYSSFKQIGKSFMAEVIAKLPDTPFSGTDLDALDLADTNAVRALRAFFFGVDDDTVLPRPCLRKDVLHEFLLRRGKLLGERWKGFKKHVKNNCVDWVSASPWQFTWEANSDGKEVVKTIKHISGFEAPPDSITITRELVYDKPYNDHLALLTKGKLKPYVREIVGEWPCASWFTSEHTKAMAKEIKAELDAKQDTSLTGEGFLHSRRDQQKEEAKKKRRPPSRSEFQVPLSLDTAPAKEVPVLQDQQAAASAATQ